MASFRALARSSLLTLATYVSIPSLGHGAQPPNVVESDANANTAMGSGSLSSLFAVAPAGFQPGGNTGSGYFTLNSNTFGYNNTALGASALQANTEGTNNTAAGWFALNDSTTGNYNTAVGSSALQLNSTGSGNTALGFGVLFANKGSNNTAMGINAMQVASGSNNTAVGVDALREISTGNYNTAVGVSAMFDNQTGLENTALGHNALASNQSGSNNIALGSSAGYYVRGGRYNIEIGSPGTANDVGTIRIGTSNQQSAAYVAGITNAHLTGSAVYISSTGQLGVLASSERYKTAVVPMGAITGRLNELRPVTFRLKTDRGAGRQFGLIAEEVAKVYPELVIRDEKGKIEGVRYEELTPMLLNELQQQQRRLATQEGRLAEQQAELQTLETQLMDLREAMQKRTH